MLKKILLALTVLSAVTFCFDIRVGSYIKGSFASNDARLNKVFTLVSSNIISKNGGDPNVTVLPVAVYSQIVNGVNYRIIAAIKDSKNKQVQLANTIVYSGPFTDNYESQNPTISFYEKLPPNTNFSLSAVKEEAIKNAIDTHLGNNATLEKINNTGSAGYPDLVYTEGFYIINADVTIGSVAANQYFVLNENADKSFTVVQSISFN